MMVTLLRLLIVEAITDYGIDVEVLLGAHELTSSTSAQQRISVERIINHESYDSSTQDNDIAVLKLATKASLNENVKPACLPSVSEDYTGFTATVSGWGTLSSGGSQPDVLQEVQVPVVSNSECQQSYGNSISDMLCAGYDAGGKDSCQGDSGGLAVRRMASGCWQVWCHGAMGVLCPTTQESTFGSLSIWTG
ncbi:trypsin-1-like [Homarus americanus]|uniref:trypsin-1-like n=1 Tax=Homarus americanus TaxID=6706 RepID=UPI001C43AB1E|nr:trypsin-1-like [Homarus americanus]